MRRDASKEKQWRETMAEAQGSGQNMREFCRQHGIKETQFYAWRRELRTRDAEAAEKGGFVELVRPIGGTQGSGISIRIDERTSIVLERGFDSVSLTAALTAVRGAAGR